MPQLQFPSVKVVTDGLSPKPHCIDVTPVALVRQPAKLGKALWNIQ
jgi:hypothetical protein